MSFSRKLGFAIIGLSVVLVILIAAATTMMVKHGHEIPRELGKAAREFNEAMNDTTASDTTKKK